MPEPYVEKLENFLSDRFGFAKPADLKFKRMSQRRLQDWLSKDDTIDSKVVNLSMNDFLTDHFAFDPTIEKTVSETIQRENLAIYTGIVSYDGRGSAALSTGGNTFENLRIYEEQGLIKRFLTYQGDRNSPSPLCHYAVDKGIKIYFVDDVEVLDRSDRVLLEKRSRGKTENILKCLLLLNQEIKTAGLNPDKIFILFLDDDYCLLDDRAHYILIASWVLSFARSRAKGIGRLIRSCRDVGFVKNGGVRIHIPAFLGERILKGEVIKNYRSLLVETLKLELDLGRTAGSADRRSLRRLKRNLQQVPPDVIVTPENLEKIITDEEVNLIRRIMPNYFYSGGRVTKPYTRKNVHESENALSNWLGQFTFILHGDQGTSLSNWLLQKLGQGYAFDSSVLIQFLMDECFADQRIVDVRNTPHAHQPQEQDRVEGMEDLINLDTETLRVYYRNWDVESFMARYQRRTRVRWLSDGRYVRERVQPASGILFYPPAHQLKLRGVRY
jgi:hypothetical protein